MAAPDPAHDAAVADLEELVAGDPDAADDDGYFVIPVEVLERWRASTPAR